MTWRALFLRLVALWRLRKATYTPCADCGATLLAEEIEAAGHNYLPLVCIDCAELRRLAHRARLQQHADWRLNALGGQQQAPQPTTEEESRRAAAQQNTRFFAQAEAALRQRQEEADKEKARLDQVRRAYLAGNIYS